MSGAVRLLVEHLTSDRSGTSVDPWFWLLGAVAVALGLFTALRYYWVTRLGERIVADLRKSVYGHILTLDPAFFIATRTGEVLSRLTTDIQIIENLLATSASIFLRNTLILIGALILMLLVSPKLTLLVLLIIPVVVVPLFLFARPLRNLTTATQDEFARAVGHAGETLDALETVQAFGREGAATQRFGAAVERSFRTSLRRMAARAVMTAAAIVLVFGGVVAVFWLGVHAGQRGELTWGALFQFAFLSVFAASAVGALGEMWGDVLKAAGAMERIAELLSARPGIARPAAPQALAGRGEVRFEEVVFAYPGREATPALDGFTLTVAPGERVALVGPSGAGKSTVCARLIPAISAPSPPWWPRTVRSSPAPPPTISPSAVRARVRRMSGRPPGRPRPKPSSRPFPRATRRRWGSAQRASPAARGSAWPSPVPSSARRPSCCWTRRPAPWTPRTRSWSRKPWTRPCAAGRPW
jgi:ATP-binding cassette subfamily B protein